MKEEGAKKVVFIPAELYNRIEERVETTDYSSVDEYVESVLEKAINEEEGESDFTEVEEKEVKKRLKDLGYLS